MSQSISKHGDGTEHGPDVTVSINNRSYTIHRGRQTVVELKQLGAVALAEELEQVLDGVFTPLPDDGAVTIKGGEIFISHVRASAAA